MDEGPDEAADLNGGDQLDASSCDSDDDRFYFVRLKILRDLKRHRLALHREEMALSCQMRSVRQSLNRMMDELKDANEAYAAREETISTQDDDILKLIKENRALKAQCQNIDSEVEDSDVEEEEKNPRLDTQNKSWWQRQAEKVAQGVRTLRLQLRCCLGVRTRKRRVVQPATCDVHIGLPAASIGMPPVSV